jgi:hypothetical protein
MAKVLIRMAGKRPHLCALCSGDILPGQEYKQVGSKRQHHDPDCERAEPQEIDCAPRFVPAHMLADPDWRLQRSGQLTYGWRFIRSYRRVAKHDYDCKKCSSSSNHLQQNLSTIFAGDEYYAEVYVSAEGWEIRKYHDECPLVPEDPESDRKDKEEEEPEGKKEKAAKAA